jgi:hypothetical protein
MFCLYFLNPSRVLSKTEKNTETYFLIKEKKNSGARYKKARNTTHAKFSSSIVGRKKTLFTKVD